MKPASYIELRVVSLIHPRPRSEPCLSDNDYLINAACKNEIVETESLYAMK